jgi:hypothetical protein
MSLGGGGPLDNQDFQARVDHFTATQFQRRRYRILSAMKASILRSKEPYHGGGRLLALCPKILIMSEQSYFASTSLRTSEVRSVS